MGELGLTTRAVSALWYGPVRRPVRKAAAAAGVERRGRVLVGPLRGKRYWNDLAGTVGVYEMDMQALLLRHLKPGDVFYDVGANYGFFTLLGAQLVGSTGTVVAIEPWPSTAAELRKVVKANGEAVHVVEAAVADGPGTAVMRYGTHSAGAAIGVLEGREHVTVETTALDALCDQYGFPTFVKMDIEGAELAALQGATRLLEAHPTLALEIHSAELDAEIGALLDNAGYRVVEREPRRRGRDYPVHVLAVT